MTFGEYSAVDRFFKRIFLAVQNIWGPGKPQNAVIGHETAEGSKCLKIILTLNKLHPQQRQQAVYERARRLI